MKKALEAAIKAAQDNLGIAEKALSDFEKKAENNVFGSLEEANALEEVLRDRAYQDCEGAGNCGASVYEQEFMVDGVVYVGVLTVEYNRHDKTYYYIDSAEFSVSAKAQ